MDNSIEKDDYSEWEEDEEINQYENLGICGKIKHITNEFMTACREKKILVICLFGSAISRLYSVLFSTFWLLYIASFIGSEYVENQEKAQMIYANMMIVSVVFGVTLVPLVGKIADKYNP